MLCKCHWIVLYTVHFTAFCLGEEALFSGHGVIQRACTSGQLDDLMLSALRFRDRNWAIGILSPTDYFRIMFYCRAFTTCDVLRRQGLPPKLFRHWLANDAFIL